MQAWDAARAAALADLQDDHRKCEFSQVLSKCRSGVEHLLRTDPRAPAALEQALGEDTTPPFGTTMNDDEELPVRLGGLLESRRGRRNLLETLRAELTTWPLTRATAHCLLVAAVAREVDELRAELPNPHAIDVGPIRTVPWPTIDGRWIVPYGYVEMRRGESTKPHPADSQLAWICARQIDSQPRAPFAMLLFAPSSRVAVPIPADLAAVHEYPSTITRALSSAVCISLVTHRELVAACLRALHRWRRVRRLARDVGLCVRVLRTLFEEVRFRPHNSGGLACVRRLNARFQMETVPLEVDARSQRGSDEIEL